MQVLTQKQQRSERTAWWIRVIFYVLVVGALAIVGGCLCDEKQSGAEMAGLLGAPKDVSHAENSAELDDIGQYAVDQYNSKEGKNLSFKKIVSAKKQVVSGTMYHLVIEVHGDEAVKNFEAKVLHKPWQNHKSLELFKPHDGTASN